MYHQRGGLAARIDRKDNEHAHRYTNTKPALRGNSKDLDNCRVTQKDTKYKTIEKKLLKEST